MGLPSGHNAIKCFASRSVLLTIEISTLACLNALVPGNSGTAWAQTKNEFSDNDTPLALPAVVVTTEKIERSLETVAASVAVVDGMDIEQSGITRMEQLEGRVPGLSFQPFGQAGMNSPVMRGLTANFSSFSTSTLLLVDGVPTLTAQGFEHSMLDLESIEVMRGPQSTLYGRNAESGVISIRSMPMDSEPRGSISVEAGSRDKQVLQFALNKPIVENQLYASIAGHWTSQDGFIDNILTSNKADDRERRDLRLGLRWTPSAATDVVLRYAQSLYDDGATLWGAPATQRTQVASGTPSWNRSWGQTFSLKVQHEIASGLKLHSITAANDFRDRVQQDTDFKPADILHIGRNNHLRTLSQEFRLDGRIGAADWLVGLYADRTDNDLQTLNKTMMGLSDIRANQKGSTTALFTNWNVPLIGNWMVSAGGRVERSTVKLLPVRAMAQRKEWTSVSPKLALQYHFNPEQQWYASVTRGLRAGGFNVLSPVANYSSFEPEKVWSYETGIKGMLLNRRMRYSLSAYTMDIRDMQVMQMPRPGLAYISSAATATSRGIEMDVNHRLGQHWQITGGVAWNHTRFDRFLDGITNYRGQRNPFAPDLTGHLGVRYQAPKSWYAQATIRGSGMVYLDAANRYKRNGFGMIDLVAGHKRGNWEMAAYVHNAANRRHDAVGYQNGFVTVYSPPREVAVRITWQM